MAERDPRHDDVVEFDFGDSAPKGAPLDPADDPFDALAGELSTSLEQDEGRRRRLAADEQRRLTVERAGTLESAAVDADQLEIDLRSDLLAGDTATEAGPRFVDVRVGGRGVGRTAGAGPLRRLFSLVGTLLSTGPDQSKLPRVLAGYASRLVAGAGLVWLIVTAVGAEPGSAFDLSYAPESALVRHMGGLGVRVETAVAPGRPVTGATAVDEQVAIGLRDAGRSFFLVFDQAAASGEMDPLRRLFARPEAAAPWIELATSLHADGARRRYPLGDPVTINPGFLNPASDTVELIYAGVFEAVDVLPGGKEIRREDLWAVQLRYVLQNGVWLIDELVYLR